MNAPLPGLDLERLRSFLAGAGVTGAPLTGELIPGGRSNLTYLVTDGDQEWVLRRPPLGHVLATAHDMAREHRVITALAGTPVPVPATVLRCDDPEVLGAPFYLMEKVDGTVYRTGTQVASIGAPERTRLARAMVQTLAALHRVDPAAVGLADFGRPDGFLARQVRRWQKQLDASRSRDLPGVDALAQRLAGAIPESPAPGIVHGDYRLDNLLVRDGEISAVLDWEMSTLGDPLADLGLLLVYWEVIAAIDNPAVRSVGAPHGFPPGATLTEWYAAGTGADLSTLDWYVALGCFKLAVILEGIHFRHAQGLTVGEGFDQIGTAVGPLVEAGLTRLH